MRNRRGVALLEVLIAMTILSVAAVSLITVLAQATRSLDSARRVETEARDASRLMETTALWTRDDLDRHLGSRVQGPWRMHVTRPLASLYVVSISDSTERRELLRTSLFRPANADAPR